MLPGVCPGCGLRADLDVFCAQADVNKALAAALEFPATLGGRVLAYLRLFSPPSKTLALTKATRLLMDLTEAVKSAQVRRHGLIRVVPLDLWGLGLDVVLAKPPEVLPLTNHNYLFQTVWNLAEKAAAQQERAAEERLTHPREGVAPGLQTVSGLLETANSMASAAPAPRPRAEPPPEFKALLRQLTGKTAFPSTPSPTQEE